MQCWYFGNYPSVMNRAAGRCSFEPFPESEEALMFELAEPDWGGSTPTVVGAWKRFRDAYEQFPANVLFAHYSPVHDSLCWPLHLEPVDLPIAPSWQLGFPPSGDRVGECIGYFHTLEEALLLMDRVVAGWQSGLDLLLPLVQPGLGTARVREIGVAEALGLQFRSAARGMALAGAQPPDKNLGHPARPGFGRNPAWRAVGAIGGRGQSAGIPFRGGRLQIFSRKIALACAEIAQIAGN